MNKKWYNNENKYRKKPVVIEAIQLTEEMFWDNYETNKRVFDKFTFSGSFHPGNRTINNVYVLIKTLEGTMKGEIGDWIIKGVNGEFYPCKNDIFQKTYEKV